MTWPSLVRTWQDIRPIRLSTPPSPCLLLALPVLSSKLIWLTICQLIALLCPTPDSAQSAKAPFGGYEHEARSMRMNARTSSPLWIAIFRPSSTMKIMHSRDMMRCTRRKSMCMMHAKHNTDPDRGRGKPVSRNWSLVSVSLHASNGRLLRGATDFDGGDKP
ncbi:hypothetical protein MRB53_037297 [Persea americana]|nr:hypothetical protein MRB53_037297 [Persea americana]